MLRNYLTTFVRILLRQKGYSTINIFGLAIGIAASLLIALYITDELSYDRFHTDADRIYRIGMHWKLNDYDSHDAYTPTPLANELQKNISGIESVIRINFLKPVVIRFGDESAIEEKIMLADSNFFKFFSFKLIAGERNTVLQEPNNIVLTQTAVLKYFGYSATEAYQAIGKMVVVGDDKQTMEVTGIAEDPPANSHFHFNVILSISSLPSMPWWLSTRGDYTYIKLQPAVKIGTVENNFPKLLKTFIEPELINTMRKSLSDLEKQGDKIYLVAQPITAIHLNSHGDSEIEENGNQEYLYMMGIIAFAIIILSCVNFVNLSTARALSRSKEIGIRKTVGAIQSKIIKQHLLESYLYTFLGFMLALSLISLAISPFNLLTSKNFTIFNFFQPVNIVITFFLFTIIGLLAGAYPSFYLTRFRPSEVLKGKLNSSQKGSGIRSGLVTIQFAISISLIIFAFTIYQQINLLLKSDVGFNKDNVIYSMNANSLYENKNAFVNELQEHEEIRSCSFVSSLFPDLYLHTLNQTGTDRYIDFYSCGVDLNSAKALDLKLVQGRYFSLDYRSDSSALIINETAANMLGITDLSQKYTLSSLQGEGFTQVHEIIGIVKDLNFQSLKNQINPMVLRFRGGSKMLISLTPGDIRHKIEIVQSVWKKYSDAPFEYGFLDEKYASLYKNEEKLGRVAFIFSGLAIIIACLGLLGLVTYMASQRTKEIGIRKIMGASVQQIVVLLSKDFLRLVIIAFFIATPISWYGIDSWLENFAYRIDFNFIVAISAGIAVLFIALLTLSYQSIKAAMCNPVESLRSE